jgi:hypothetical protein
MTLSNTLVCAVAAVLQNIPEAKMERDKSFSFFILFNLIFKSLNKIECIKFLGFPLKNKRLRINLIDISL